VKDTFPDRQVSVEIITEAKKGAQRMSPMKPLNISYSIDPMSFEPKEEIIVRKLSQMRDAFKDQDAVDKILALEQDPKIVEVFMAPIAKEDGSLMVNINTVTIGGECYMTKGHIHSDPFLNPEIYVTMQGRGKLLLQTLEGDVHIGDLKPGGIYYIPSNWAHRCVNVGEEPLVYLGFFPASTERDYSFGKGDKRFKNRFFRQGEETKMIVDG
jgi:glucose-6-phosphate isomerase